MEPFHEHKPLAVLANQDRGQLALFQHALGDLVDDLGIEGLAPLGGHVDPIDPEGLVLHELCHRHCPVDRWTQDNLPRLIRSENMGGIIG